ncbi:ester cyclase [Haloferax elongans]|nr:ester cyclase [Haloferax elongans]
MAATEETNKQLVRRSNDEIWGDGNLDIIEGYVADDYVEHNAASPQTIHGPEGYKENVQIVRSAFPDLEVTTEDVIAEDDKVVTRYTLRGTHEGELMGIEPTGKTIEVQGISIGRFEDETVVEGWSVIDMMSMMQQLGIVETPG